MKFLILSILLACVNASAADTPCRADADCSGLGDGYQCVTEHIECAVHPESSTCAQLVCRKKPGWPVKDEDRTCKTDEDCAIVQLTCQCMYCARPTDFLEGIVSVANKKRTKKYESLGKCSKEQMHSCSMSGACAISGTYQPQCRVNMCVVQYVPRSEP